MIYAIFFCFSLTGSLFIGQRTVRLLDSALDGILQVCPSKAGLCSRSCAPITSRIVCTFENLCALYKQDSVRLVRSCALITKRIVCAFEKLCAHYKQDCVRLCEAVNHMGTVFWAHV